MFKIDFLGFLSGPFLQFLIYKSSRYFLSMFESVGILVQEKFKIDFQDGGHLGFLIRMILGIFDLQVMLILPTMFLVFWL